MTTTLAPLPVTAAQVTLLQAVRAYPCVSVLLPTTPGPVLADTDAARLRSLVRQAQKRCAAEGVAPDGPLMTRLEELADEAVAGPAGAGLALFCGGGTARLVRLPLAPVERVVVDPTFATRDLVRALHRTPRHWVLLLSGNQARLLEGVGGVLRPFAGGLFPVDREDDRPGIQDAWLRRVDRTLGAVLRKQPAPVVLVGPAPLAAALRHVAKNLHRLAGVVPGNHHRDPLPLLAERVRPVLDAYLHGRQEEALALAARRRRSHRLVSGLASVWLAARREHPEMLAVEDDLMVPARLACDGDVLVPASDVEAPDVLDDAVDELIETVLERGGWVALVEPGALAEHGGVVLTLRARP